MNPSPAIPAYVAVLVRPDGTSVIVGAETIADVLMKLLNAVREEEAAHVPRG